MKVRMLNNFKLIVLVVFSIYLSTSCTLSKSQKDLESLKEEVRQTEHDFAKMANDKSIAVAFKFYASDDVVLNRNNKLIKGKAALYTYFENPGWDKIELDWKPDFIDVSASGDLAYTYGNYTLTQIDSVGKKIKSTGIFHTVWKKEKDGKWKFVWD